jgi:predicted small metal-binding protein
MSFVRSTERLLAKSAGTRRIQTRARSGMLCPSLRRRRPGREDRGGLVWRLVMALRIICMCGYVIQGDDDDELWQNAQGHMGVLHPELVGNVTREDLLAQAEQL